MVLECAKYIEDGNHGGKVVTHKQQPGYCWDPYKDTESCSKSMIRLQIS